jgi:hypothetical protein
MCAVCKQGVAREHMIYQKGRVFHERCYETHGSMFPPINTELAQLSAKTRIELVQMKNLKVRSDAGLLEEAAPKAKAKKSVKKSARSSKSKKAKPKKKTSKKAKKPASKRRK